MSKVFLTSAFVKRVSCPSDRRKIDYFDVQLPGFLIEVRATGGKTYYQRYRTPHGRERQFKIGAASVLTVQQARRKAKAIAASALIGTDPQETRATLRQMPVYRDFLMNEYMPFAKSNKRSWRTDLAVVRTHVVPNLGRLFMDQVTPSLVVGVLQKMQGEGYASGTVNRVIILIKHTFNLARQWGVPGTSNNPTWGIKTAPDVKRERFLTDDELIRLRASLEADENQVAASAIKVLVLTGARRNEVTHARWEYVDWINGTLKVPLSKTGTPRWITLNSTAIALVRSIQQRSKSEFIFPSPVTGRPCPSLHFPWSRIKKRAGLDGLRLHDLRHSYASFLVNDGVELYTVQNLLGHTHPRATQRYAHLTQDTLKDAAEIVSKKFDLL
jgi:integrase